MARTWRRMSCGAEWLALGLAAVLALGATAARADLYLLPSPPVMAGGISGQQTRLRPRVADLEGDGRPDVVFTMASCGSFPCATNSAYSMVFPILLNAAGRPTTYQGILEGGYSDAQDVGAINVTGDAHPDLVVTSPGTGWINPFEPGFAYLFGGPTYVGLPGHSLALGHFDADDLADEAVAQCDGAGGDVAVALGTGPWFPVFGSPTAYGAGSCPADVAAADLNADDILDLAVASGDRPGDPAPQHGLFVLLGNGDGTFASADLVDGSLSDPRSLSIADVDGDGHLDIVAGDHATGRGVVFAGRGDGTFRQLVEVDALEGIVSLATTDLDGDAIADVVVGFDAEPIPLVDNAVGVLMRLDDPGTMVLGVLDAGGSGTRRVAAGDFNGDGFGDLAVTHDGSMDLTIFRNAPAIGFGADNVAFGAVELGSASAPGRATVKNLGMPPLHIGSLRAVAGSARGSDYVLETDGCSGQVLATGQSCVATVRFRPSAVGPIDGALIVPSDASLTGEDALELQGTGRQPSATTPPPPAAPTPPRAPRLTLNGPSVQRALRKRAITLTALCDRACTVTASGTLGLPTAARLYRLGPVKRTLKAGQRTTLKLRLGKQVTKAVRRSLALRRQVLVRVLVATQEAGTPSARAARTVRIVG